MKREPITELAIIDQATLCYAPWIDRQHAVGPIRLSVFPLRPGSALDATQLLQTLAQAWPGGGAAVILHVVDEDLLDGLLQAPVAANVTIEVPAFVAADPARHATLRALRDQGQTLLLGGPVASAWASDLVSCFSHSMIDLADLRGTMADQPGSALPAGRLRRVYSGIRTRAEMQTAFDRGAVAVLGWPFGEAPRRAAAAAQPVRQAETQVIVELIRRVMAEEPIERLELTLRRDPTLAFRLLRYMNSAAFGLRVEITSFAHALLMLGHRRLVRWLALLLATAATDTQLKPLLFAAVRRGLLLEQLADGTGDAQMRDEMFICGVFSLLDIMFAQPFSELLASLPMPDRVAQALLHGAGPYAPYLALARAIEGGSPFEVRAAAANLLLGAGEVNRALLCALAGAAQLG